MPVLPEAPGTFDTGSATPRIGWAGEAVRRAMASAPPPVPHVQMKSMGRDGYFSCAATDGAPTAPRRNSANPTTTLRLSLMRALLVFVGTSRRPPRAGPG